MRDAGSVVTTYLRHSFSEVTGGPWVGVLLGHAYLVPKSWAVALSVALLLALVGFTLQKGGPSARASWALFVAYLATSVGLLMVLGEGDMTSSLGLVHRFAADLAPVTAICVAGCLREVRVQPLRLPRLSCHHLRAALRDPAVAGICRSVHALVRGFHGVACAKHVPRGRPQLRRKATLGSPR